MRRAGASDCSWYPPGNLSGRGPLLRRRQTIADHRTAVSSQAADARRLFFWMVKTRAKFWAKSTLHLLRTVLIVTAWFQESEVEHDSHDYACTRCGLTVSQRKATMFVLVQVLAEGCVTGSTSARRHRDEPASKLLRHRCSPTATSTSRVQKS